VWELAKDKSINSGIFHQLIRRYEIQQARKQNVPDGWYPDDHIGGFFEHYRDYLAQSQTPQELDMRKIYVIQWINYQRKMEKVGTMKNFLAGMVSLFRDPINFGIGALTGGIGGMVSGGLLRAGAGRATSLLLTGAAEGATFDIASTTMKRAIDTQVQGEEFRILESAMFGGVMGVGGSIISDAARFSHFKRSYPKAHANFSLYRATDTIKDTIYRNPPKGATAATQLDMLQELRTQTSKFVNGTLDSHKFRYFDIAGEVDKVGAIARYMEAPVVKGLSNAVDGMGRLFSNHMRLLGSELDGYRVAAMKIWNTPTREEPLMARVGNELPLDHQITIANAISEKNIHRTMNQGIKVARGEGISKQEFNNRLFDALNDNTSYALETSTAVKAAADGIRQTITSSAEKLHAVGGFEYQQAVRDRMLDTARWVHGKMKNIPSGDTATMDALKNSLKIAEEEYSFAMSPASLRVAQEKMGGYFPRRLDGTKVQMDRKGAEDALYQSYITGEGSHIRKKIMEKHGEIMQSITATTPTEIWQQYKEELRKRGWDVFRSPGDDAMSIDPTALVFSDAFYADARNLAKDRATDAIQGAIGYNQPYSSRRVKLRRAEEAVLEEPKLDFRASAKSRTHHDDYATIRPYLVDDVSELANTYTKQMNSDAAMVRLFGDTHAKRLQAEIAAEYNDNLRAIGISPLSEKQKLRNTTRLMRDYNLSAEAMETAINNLKGFTGIDWSSMRESTIARSLLRIGANWNVARYLGDSIFAQLQDQANVALHLNGWRTLGQTMENFTKTLLSKDFRKMLYNEHINDFGVGCEIFSRSQRADSLISSARQCDPLGTLDMLTEKAARASMAASGTKYLDAFTQCNTSYITGCELKRMAETFASGKRLKPYQLRLAQEYSIGSNDLAILNDQFKKFSEVSDGMTFINVSRWDNKAAKDIVTHVLHDSATNATMVPGAKLPAIFNTPMGKIMFQFKRFATSTYDRMFLESLRQGRPAIANTVAMCLLLDATGKICKNFGKPYAKYRDTITDKPRKLTPAEMVFKAIEESVTTTDWTSWAFDPTGIMASIIHPQWGNEFGGTYSSLVRDLGIGTTSIFKKVNGDPISDREARSLIRLLPLQNHMIFRAAVAMWPDDNPPLPYPAERHLGRSRDEHHANQLGKISRKTKRSKSSNIQKNYSTKGLTNE
jgi:hypothetical protein